MTLKKGKVYRTQDFAKYGSNPTRFASALVKNGSLIRLQNGLFHAPKQGAFGIVPPSEAALLKGHFGSKPYLVTGPSVWNTLELGTTGVESLPLVYNTTKTGRVLLGKKAFEFRRVRFPPKVDPEYLVVDLFENLDRAGTDAETVGKALIVAVRHGRFDPEKLQSQARTYGTRATQGAIQTACEGSI